MTHAELTRLYLATFTATAETRAAAERAYYTALAAVLKRFPRRA